jgi:macrodomain Ter protein organizer (MatP/YcbG family)
MALSNAEKQARWRERHLKSEHGTKCRIPLTVEATTKAQLSRLTHHRNCSISTLITGLVASAERRVTAHLSGRALKAYLDRE